MVERNRELAEKGMRAQINLLNGSIENGKLEPIDDYVVVELGKMPEQTSGGLWVPESVQENALQLMAGRVVAVGPGRLERHMGEWSRKPMGIEVGDFVLCNPYANDTVKTGQEKCLIVRESSITCKVRGVGDVAPEVAM